MNIPQKAFILAAGLGKRLNPITLKTPKPLIRVGELCSLQFILQKLYAVGVKQVVINTHHLAHEIHNFVKHDKRIIISYENELFDSGGGVYNMIDVFNNQPFYLINGDYFWQEDNATTLLERLALTWQNNMKALLTVVPKKLALGYNGEGDFSLNNQLLVYKTRTHNVAPFVCANISIMHPQAYWGFHKGECFSNKKIWLQLEKSNHLYGLIHNQLWVDIGSHQALKLAKNIQW